MESLLKIIKETNLPIRENPERFVGDIEIMDYYKSAYEKIKDKVNIEHLNVFESVCLQDFNFNFPEYDSSEVKEEPNTTIIPSVEMLQYGGDVKKLADFNKAQLDLIDKAKKAKPILNSKPDKRGFNTFGLRHDINLLNEVSGAIVFLPLEEIAEYCDVVTKAFVDADDRFWIVKLYNDLVKTYSDDVLMNFGATHIGNFAYVALHCKHKPSVEASMIILNKYYELLMVTALSMNKNPKDIRECK